MSDVYTDDFVLEDEDDLGIEGPEIALAEVDTVDVDALEVDEDAVDELDVDALEVDEGEISLAQADTAAEAPESYRDLALRLYANTRGMPWFSEYMKKQGVESGESASVESIAEAIKSEDVTPEEIIYGISRAYNSDRNSKEMYYQAHASAPKHAERYLEGRTQKDIAKREMIFNLAQDAGIPESYIQDLLKQPGVNTDRIISQLTGWRDVEGIGEGVELLGEFGLRSWGEDVGPAIAGAKVAGQVYKWSKPIQLGLAWNPVLGRAAQLGSVAVAGASGVTTYLLGTTFLTKPFSDMLFGPREQLTPRAQPWGEGGRALGEYSAIGYPVRKMFAAIPETIGAKTVMANLDMMNATWLQRLGQAGRAVYPGFSPAVKNFVGALGDAARASYSRGPLKNIPGAPWAVNDKMVVAGFASGEWLAEREYPGSLGAKIIFGIGGGIVNPPRVLGNLLFTAAPRAISALTSQAKGRTGYPSEKDWGGGTNWLRKLLHESGISEERIQTELIPILESTPAPIVGKTIPPSYGRYSLDLVDPAGKTVPLPAGTKTGFAPLVALQQVLQGEKTRIVRPQKIPDPDNPGEFIEVGISGGPTLRSVLENNEDAGVNAIAQLINVLRRTGSPEDIKLATKVEQQLIEDAIQTNLEQTIQRALNAAERISGKTDARTTMDAGKTIHELMVKAVEDSSKQVQALYDKAATGLKVEVETPNLVSAWNKITADVKESGTGEIPEVLMDMPGMKLLGKFFQRRGATDEADQSMEVLQQAAASVRAEKTRLRTSEASVDNDMAKSSQATKVVTRSLDISDTEILTLHTLPPDERAMVLRELAEIAEDYRGPLGKTLSPKLDATTRTRVATLAEKISSRIRSQERLESAQNVLQTTEVPTALGEIEGFSGPIGELVKLRSYLLDRMRTAGANSEWNEARILGELEEGIQKDIDVLLEGGVLPEGLAVDETIKAAIDTLRFAQNAAKKRFDVLSRSMASNVIARASSGATRLPPEALVHKLFGGGSDPTALVTRDIFDAVSFVVKETGDLSAEQAAALRGETLMGLYDSVLRRFATRIMRPVPDPDNPGQFIKDPDRPGQHLMAIDDVAKAKFIGDFENVLDMRGMETLKASLEDPNVNIKHITALMSKDSAFRRSVEDQAQFAAYWNKTGRDLTGASTGQPVENPSVVIAEALGDPLNAAKNFQRLANNIARGEIRVGNTPVKILSQEEHSAVMRGFRDAVIDWAWTTAQRGDGSLDMKVLTDKLFRPMTRDKDSVMGVLRRSGRQKIPDPNNPGKFRVVNDPEKNIVSTLFLRNLQTTLRTFRRIQEASLRKTDLASVIGEDPSGMEIFGLRVVGSQVGSWAARLMGRGTLIAQSAGSKLVTDAVGRMPKFAERAAIATMVNDPPLMAAMLRKGPMTRKQLNLISKFFAKVLGTSLPAAAINEAINDIAKERFQKRREEQELERERASRDRIWTPRRPPVSLTSAPQAAPPPPQAAAAPPPQAAPPVQTAAAAAPPGGLTYDQVFPDDRTISPLLEGRRDRQQRQQLAATQGLGSLA